MKFNGATFNKAQQDQLKKKVGAELDVIAKATLKKYTFTLSKNAAAIQRAERIFLQSKGKCTFFLGTPTDAYANKIALGEPVAMGLNGEYPTLSFLVQKLSALNIAALYAYTIHADSNPEEKEILINSNGSITFTRKILSKYNVYVTYYNDTEIL